MYVTDRTMESIKMVERFIEISKYFYCRCSKINSSTERTEESLLLTIFRKRSAFCSAAVGDIPFVHSSVGGEILFFKLLIGQKIIFCSLKFCRSKWELYSL